MFPYCEFLLLLLYYRKRIDERKQQEDKNMAIDRVREYFRQYHMEDRIREFEVSSATVELAAEALGCEGKESQNRFPLWWMGRQFWWWPLVMRK